MGCAEGDLPIDAILVLFRVAWTPPLGINETTGAYFKKLATMAPADVAKIYRDILNPDPKISKAASDWLLDNQPNHWSMVHTSLVPTIVAGTVAVVRDAQPIEVSVEVAG